MYERMVQDRTAGRYPDEDTGDEMDRLPEVQARSDAVSISIDMGDTPRDLMSQDIRL